MLGAAISSLALVLAAAPPPLADVQTPPRQLPADAPRPGSLLVDRQGRPIDSLAAWQRRRAELRAAWLDFLGRMDADRPPIRLEIVESETVRSAEKPDVIRQLVRYQSEPGETVRAYLLRPAAEAGRRPGVVALHSTTDETIRQPAGLAGDPHLAFGLHLAQRGMVVVCPECFLWRGPGDLQDRTQRWLDSHPGKKGLAKMLFDASRAVDVLASLPDVDADRLGAIGHSLGGKEVLYLAALDERVRAAVSSEGGIDIGFSNWDADWYLSRAVHERDFARGHHELLALVAPRAFLLVGGDSADGDRSWPHVARALEVYDLFGRRPLGLLNHRAGHSLPADAEERAYLWLEHYLADE